MRQLRDLLRHWLTTPPLVEVVAGIARGFGYLREPDETHAPEPKAMERNELGGHGPIYTREEVMSAFGGFFN